MSCTPCATWVVALHAHASQALHDSMVCASADHCALGSAAHCCVCSLSAAQDHLDLGVEAFREVSQPAGRWCLALCKQLAVCKSNITVRAACSTK